MVGSKNCNRVRGYQIQMKIRIHTGDLLPTSDS